MSGSEEKCSCLLGVLPWLSNMSPITLLSRLLFIIIVAASSNSSGGSGGCGNTNNSSGSSHDGVVGSGSSGKTGIVCIVITCVISKLSISVYTSKVLIYLSVFPSCELLCGGTI